MTTFFLSKRNKFLSVLLIMSASIICGANAPTSFNFPALKSIIQDADYPLSALLSNIESLSARAQVSKDDILDINRQLRTILKSSTLDDRLEIISTINDHIFFQCYDLIHQILLHSVKDIPSLQHFFYFDEDSAYLKPESLLFLNDHFKRQYPNWIDKKIVHLSYKSLNDYLLTILSGEEGHSYVVLERYTDFSPEDKDFHLTPLFIEKKSGKLTLIAMDSKGLLRDPYHVNLLQSVLSDIKCDTPIDAYVLNECRQSDWFSCSIFSFLDLRNIIEMEHTLFSLVEFASENATLLETLNSTVTLYKLNSLPPSMLKVTQSIRQISEWCRTPSPIFHCVERLSIDDQSSPIIRLQNADQMTRAVDYYSVYGDEGEQVNYYLTKKWINCVYILCNEAIKITHSK